MTSSSNSSPNPVNNAVQGLISTLSGLVSNISPFAKAVVPGVAGLVGSFVTMAFTGQYDWPNIEVLGVGVVTSIVVYVVPNLTKTAPTPVAPVAPAAQKPAA